MKQLVLLLLVSVSAKSFSQRTLLLSQGTLPPNTHVIYGNVADARRLPRPPVYPFGVDSCQRFYFSHFTGFDSVLTKAIANGDTAKYVRVYFSFVIDRNGSPVEPHFERVASTQYARSEGAKTIKYFFDNKAYYEEVIKAMIYKMTFWKPGLANLRNSNSMIAVDSRVEDYIQFWVGIVPPSS